MAALSRDTGHGLPNPIQLLPSILNYKYSRAFPHLAQRSNKLQAIGKKSAWNENFFDLDSTLIPRFERQNCVHFEQHRRRFDVDSSFISGWEMRTKINNSLGEDFFPTRVKEQVFVPCHWLEKDFGGPLIQLHHHVRGIHLYRYKIII